PASRGRRGARVRRGERRASLAGSEECCLLVSQGIGSTLIASAAMPGMRSAKMKHAAKGVYSRLETRVLPSGRRRSATARSRAEQVANMPLTDSEYAGPAALRELVAEYGPASDLFLDDGHVPLFWWTTAEN